MGLSLAWSITNQPGPAAPHEYLSYPTGFRPIPRYNRALPLSGQRYLILKRQRSVELLLLLLLLTLAGCSLLDRDGAADASPTPAFATVTLKPEPTSTPTPTPEPTPVVPTVVIEDQSLDEAGELTSAEVVLPGPGWLVVYNEIDGAPGDPIGQTPLAGGIHQDVLVTVDPLAATETLYAGLHIDAGAEGVFEFPGEDEPYPGEPETTFAVALSLPRPVVEAAEQIVGENGVVTLARAELLQPGWVAIHADADGQIGDVIGRVRLEEGTHENVAISIDLRHATPALHAVLHEDDGEVGVPEFPDGDMPLLFNGQPVVAAFRAHYPPLIVVYDQPVVDGAVVVDRVMSDGPGWVAVYYDQDGQPGLIIGHAPLEDGLNENVRVEVTDSAVTAQLYARLHADTSPGDGFDPAADPIVRFEDRMPLPAAFRTDQGAHAIARDQTLVDDGVTVELVVSPVDTWVAIHGVDDAGQPGLQLGRVFVPAGVNRDVVVPVGQDVDPGLLYVVLYEDRGEPETFDALGVDPALVSNDGRIVRVPFTLQAADE